MESSIRVISRRESHNARFNAKQINLVVQLVDGAVDNNVNIFEWHKSCFDQLIGLVTDEFTAQDHNGIKISVCDDDASKEIGTQICLE